MSDFSLHNAASNTHIVENHSTTITHEHSIESEEDEGGNKGGSGETILEVREAQTATVHPETTLSPTSYVPHKIFRGQSIAQLLLGPARVQPHESRKSSVFLHRNGIVVEVPKENVIVLKDLPDFLQVKLKHLDSSGDGIIDPKDICNVVER
jgi:hypothetical protein